MNNSYTNYDLKEEIKNTAVDISISVWTFFIFSFLFIFTVINYGKIDIIRILIPLILYPAICIKMGYDIILNLSKMNIISIKIALYESDFKLINSDNMFFKEKNIENN